MNEALAILAIWEYNFSSMFTYDMRGRVCDNAKEIYVIMRETCLIVDRLLFQETFQDTLTLKIRENLAHMIKVIDGQEVQP